ncbi:hypothetical protein E4U02_11340 [Microbacterium paludicola]|uniref:Uncharacterized protein n=1 Tax=Microbacterium paludicola TaxID=300019 RepID=A0A4Y9FUQ0_9MICO|nr:hypothetical protein [Microbacterium paludicola]MBF0817009.1 hypothetical protein [Microbacterium paludicola]TFU32263.1 hypothetical protein E4U02_11340 [Microbacterium paludicola]
MTTIDQRCADILAPATELLAATVSAGFNQTGIPSALEAARELRAVLAQGTDGISSDTYLDWHATADDMLESMIRELEQGDPVAARKILTDPRLGLHKLTIACAGMPGW